MVIAAMLKRENPNDALVVKKSLLKKMESDSSEDDDGVSVSCLADLKPGSVVGTSSVRRVAQIKRKFPHILFQDVVKKH